MLEQARLIIENLSTHKSDDVDRELCRYLRINRAQTRLQRWRKSSGSGSGAEAATGVMPAPRCCCRQRWPRALSLYYGKAGTARTLTYFQSLRELGERVRRPEFQPS